MEIKDIVFYIEINYDQEISDQRLRQHWSDEKWTEEKVAVPWLTTSTHQRFSMKALRPHLSKKKDAIEERIILTHTK